MGLLLIAFTRFPGLLRIEAVGGLSLALSVCRNKLFTMEIFVIQFAHIFFTILLANTFNVRFFSAVKVISVSLERKIFNLTSRTQAGKTANYVLNNYVYFGLDV